MDEKRMTPQQRYDEKYRKVVSIAFFTSTEQELLDWLDRQDNKAGYIKRLIREDMARKSASEENK